MRPRLSSQQKAHKVHPARVVSFRVAPDASAPLRSTAELEHRLRRRLRLIAVLLGAATSVLAITAILIRREQLRADLSTLWTEPPLPGLLLLVSAVAMALVVALGPGHRHSLEKLRAVEWLGVSLIALFVAINQTQSLETLLPAFLGKPMEIGIAQGAPWGVIIVAYGVLVPSSIRHSVLRTAAIAVCAFIPDIIAMSALDEPMTGAASYLLLKTFIIAVMGALALYGAYRIEELRRDAEGARELGQYLLRRLLGEGGMASVYFAEHRMLRRPCAVKLIRADQPHDEVTLARFEREVQSTAALTHPNTIQVYDYGRAEDGTFFFAMEFLPGETLDALVERSGPLEPTRVVHILRQLCGALHEAHGRGLVHRDITPGNLLIGSAGTVKITDFGIAHGVADTFTTGAGRISGTPAYMSPEQICGIEVDARSDIYSLGCCLYLMLTGRPPFHCDTAIETATAHLRDEPPPPREIAPETPADLEAVVLRALAKDPADRYPTASAMRAALACGAQPDPDGTASLGDTHDNRQGPMLGTHRLAPRPAQGPRGRAGEIAADIDVGPLPGATQRRCGLLLILLGVTSLLAIAVVLILG
jgi:serine/threonine-protein kinase